jgi:citrate lyase subunit beta/citryl-CoA lyase
MATIERWRSLAFAPANRHELLAKFSKFEADSYVIDLEDGTPVDAKPSAREQLPQAVAAARSAPLAGRLLVRVNALGTPWGQDDVRAVLALPIDGIVLPKLESQEDMRIVDAAASARGRAIVTVGGIESMRGVLDIREAVRDSASLRALYFGAEDYATEMGIQRSAGGEEVLYARQRVVLAARAAGLAPIDQAVTAIRDDAIFTNDAQKGRAFGYVGKICLTPRQAALANGVFVPTSEELSHARELLSAVREQEREGRGVIAFRGQMVDAPLIQRAERLLSLAGEEAAGA